MYTILHLARQGAKVYMGARNESKATGAIKQLELEGIGSGRIEYHHLDLADPHEAKKSAEEFMKKEERLDILVNNAAMLGSEYQLTKDGLSLHMVTNYLSPYVFTETLLPLLKKTALSANTDVRIVTVASDGHRIPPLKDQVFNSKEALNNPFTNSYLGQMRLYGYTKLANILQTDALQDRLDAEQIPIICLSLHPGAIASGGAYDGVKKLPFTSFWNLMLKIFFQPSIVGGLTPAFAAAAPVVREKSEVYRKAYLVPFGKLGKKSDRASDKKVGEELMRTTELVLREIGIEFSI
ncbi:NAD-binding protein [Sistotremastrum niveocremeum HHB9708]|uniref:NAD-binding protein n=2 Tax=Sistotremastraceae TaxID=3402574 RepID=A0A164NA00_9AGAM|nr:NAD-binding protein [Sistotremastrum niveocremeum HHB9708]KZT38147.1 NAD(P)-binding protein [Sistotremastrum suecicum HHB10207 ss-3]